MSILKVSACLQYFFRLTCFEKRHTFEYPNASLDSAKLCFRVCYQDPRSNREEQRLTRSSVSDDKKLPGFPSRSRLMQSSSRPSIKSVICPSLVYIGQVNQKSAITISPRKLNKLQTPET